MRIFKNLFSRQTIVWLIVCLFVNVPGRTEPAIDTTAAAKSPPASPARVDAAVAMRKMVFEEQKIEGKIRRPQLVLIKADQRPEFNPIVMQSFGKTKNVTGLIDKEVIDKSPYSDAFQLEGMKIVNYVP